MAFTPKQITKELDMANLTKHNDNYSAIKNELDAHDIHVAAQTAHGSTPAATANKIVQRDANGRAKVAAPSASDDIARKAEVDAVQAALSTHKSDAVVHLSADDRTKFDGIEAGAEQNQNAFAQVNNIAAVSESDNLTIAGGTGITVTTNPATKTVMLTATGEATPGAHGATHTEYGADPIPTATLAEGGIMSAEQVAALTDIRERLDTPETDPVTLQPGLQVVHAAKDSRFNFGQIQGKTEINGQGRIGIIGVENPYILRKSNEDEVLSMLAFDTELHANPTDNSDPDVLFEQNGEYKKLAKWKKVVLDGNIELGNHNGIPKSGIKFVQFPLYNGITMSNIVTKFNGNLLTTGSFSFVYDAADRCSYDAPSNLGIISIANNDSGWGDSYTPTADEIKAYFNGWRMANNETWTPYNGSGTKAWGRIDQTGNLIAGSGTTVLPTTLNTQGGYSPYNLLYRLVYETIEPVVSEGCLTLTEGDNTVEVGTGIVLRERANPKLDPYGQYQINTTTTGFESTKLRNKVDKFCTVYRNSRKSGGWYWDNSDAYGNVRALLTPGMFDQSGAYSVTYIKLDKSLVQPITGTLAANEKAQISDLTMGVAEALTRVSVIEQKKAEKDAPGWITPTLLNGWTQYATLYPTAQIYKDSSNVVHFRGLIKSGALSGNILILPIGYRPETRLAHAVVVYDGTNISNGTINILPTGEVEASLNIKNSFMMLSDISFVSK